MLKKIKSLVTKQDQLDDLYNQLIQARTEIALYKQITKTLQDELKHIHTQGFYKLTEDPRFRVLDLTIEQVKKLKAHYRASTGQDPEGI